MSMTQEIAKLRAEAQDLMNQSFDFGQPILGRIAENLRNRADRMERDARALGL